MTCIDDESLVQDAARMGATLTCDRRDRERGRKEERGTDRLRRGRERGRRGRERIDKRIVAWVVRETQLEQWSERGLD
jgi:hypothetical protein